jgi:hypothetical protein
MDYFPAIGVVNRYKSEPAIRLYMEGIIAGIEASNVQLLVQNAKPLYCPGKLNLTLDQYMSILGNWIQDARGEHSPVQGQMLIALRMALPCP